MSENKSSSPRTFIVENPVLALFLGACPAMALTANVLSALGIGIAALAVMVLSNLVIGALRRVIGDGFAARIVVITFFASAVGMLMNAYAYSVYQLMGVYIAVLSVNLLVFRSAEQAGKNGIGSALADAVVTGLVFTVVLVCMAAVREVFGSASFAGISIGILKDHTIPILTQAPGGFIVFAFALAAVNRLCPARAKSAPGVACAAAGVDCAGKEEV